ncbi:MAG: hypothetical protein K2W95_31200 [Candidatus Obscuribacterales bacterium]|nr:hypothetical protein [Candidatus Obscuribacterales bacterium]
METPPILQILNKTGAMLKGDHFVYSSGKHGDVYINKNDLFAFTRACCAAGKLLAERFSKTDVDTVAGPAMCGVLPAQWTAFHLSNQQDKEVYGIFAERDSEAAFVFKRGYDKFISGKNVLIVDDIANSGGTLKKFIQVVKAAGGNVVAAAVLVNRNPKNVTADFLGAAFHSLADLEFPAYDAADCPLCRQGVAVNTTVGHGKEFVDKRELQSAMKHG